MPAGHPVVPKGEPMPKAKPKKGSHRLLTGTVVLASGTIDAAASVRGRIKAGQRIFLVARAKGKGGFMGFGVVTAGAFPVKFTLRGPASGEVEEVTVEARADQDGDAATKQAGDVLGSASGKLGTTTMVVTLSKVL